MKMRATKLEKMRATRCDQEQRFHLIRGLTLEHNIHRFKVYVKRLSKHPEVVATAARVRGKRRAKAMLASSGARAPA